MIRKFLLLALTIIMALLLWNSFTHGVFVKNLKIKGEPLKTSSYTSLVTLSETLNEKKSNLEKANNTTYQAEVKKLDVAKSYFKINKAAYDDVAATASIEDIRAVNQRKEYLLDYLWMKIGTYANDNDVKVLIDDKPNESKIYFDVSGQYIAIINFIYDLEKDEDLAFNIDNIVMQGGSTDSVTKASFVVSNINIVTIESAD